MATSHAHLASTPILQPKLQTCGFPSGATDGASRPSCCDVPRAVRPTTGLNAPNAWVTGVANLPRFNRCTYTTGRLYLNILTSLESELHDHTPISPRTVAHPSTNQGRCCLTSVIEWELVFQHRHRVVDCSEDMVSFVMSEYTETMMISGNSMESVFQRQEATSRDVCSGIAQTFSSGVASTAARGWRPTEKTCVPLGRDSILPRLVVAGS